MLKMTLIAAVARVKDRGCKFDNCCVLVGKQGTGKSTFWRYLASDEFFADTWQPKPQDLAMMLQRCWIFEIAELDRITFCSVLGMKNGPDSIPTTLSALNLPI